MSVKSFEAQLHNAWVRLFLDTAEPNVTGFSDQWADTRYVVVQAETMEQAARLLERDYPSEAGFVISAIEEVL